MLANIYFVDYIYFVYYIKYWKCLILSIQSMMNMHEQQPSGLFASFTVFCEAKMGALRP